MLGTYSKKKNTIEYLMGYRGIKIEKKNIVNEFGILHDHLDA